MITRIEIDGFKTFRNFEMDFSPLTIIAGVNGSGKSNLFDALFLLSRLAETDLKTAFSKQRGDATELFSKYGEEWFAEKMTFAVELLVDKKIRDNWGGEATLKYTRLRYELTIRKEKTIKGIDNLLVEKESLVKARSDKNKDEWIKKYIPETTLNDWIPLVKTGKRSQPYIETTEINGVITIKMPQDGKPGGKQTTANTISQTVLSGSNSVDFPHVFAVKEEMRSWKFLQLNPQVLREPTKQELGMTDTITQTGENLAAALYRIKLNDESYLKLISRKLSEILPHLKSVEVEDDKANKQYIIKIRNDDEREFTSRVLSEGTLRLLTLCILQYDENHKGLLCFEEPENGIHPFRMKAMAKLLKDLSIDFNNLEMPLRQVIINTHSPVLVGEMFEIEDSKIRQVFFAELVNQTTDVNHKRLQLYVTKMLLVSSPFENNQRKLDFSDKYEGRISFNRLEKYLGSANFEDAISKYNPISSN